MKYLGANEDASNDVPSLLGIVSETLRVADTDADI